MLNQCFKERVDVNCSAFATVVTIEFLNLSFLFLFSYVCYTLNVWFCDKVFKHCRINFFILVIPEVIPNQFKQCTGTTDLYIIERMWEDFKVSIF